MVQLAEWLVSPPPHQKRTQLHSVSCCFLCIISIITVSAFIEFVRCSIIFFYLWPNGPTQTWASSLLRFLDHTHIHTCTRQYSCEQVIIQSQRMLPTQHTHNNPKGQTDMPSVEFKPAIPAIRWHQTFAVGPHVHQNW